MAAISEEKFFSPDNRKQHLEQETLSRLGRELGVAQVSICYFVTKILQNCLSSDFFPQKA